MPKFHERIVDRYMGDDGFLHRVWRGWYEDGTVTMWESFKDANGNICITDEHKITDNDEINKYPMFDDDDDLDVLILSSINGDL